MMRRFTCLAVPALLVAACTPTGEGGDPDATPTPGPIATAPDDPETQAPVGGARQFTDQTDTFVFEYSYPQEAGEIPRLAAWLDQRLERQRQALATEAARGREAARDNGFPFNPYSSGTAWEVVADIPGWLSLSAALDSYRGGAHGNFGFDTIVWDKEREIALEPIALFTSPAALDEVLAERLCEALNAEREQRRGEPVAEGSNDPFDACVRPDETNVLLGSRGGRRFDRIGIQIAPYIAGPYAEGTYEFEFDMDEELLGIVRPEFREAFATRN